MRSTSVFGIGLILVLASLLTSGVAIAQGSGNEAPAGTVESSHDAADSAKIELQRLYRQLAELQIQLAQRSREGAGQDSLLALREQLLDRIRESAVHLERHGAPSDMVPPPPPRGGDLFVIVEELGRLSEDVDWEQVGKVIEDNADGLGEGLGQLSELLKDLKVDVGPDKVSIDAGSGSRFTFTIPEEMREELSQGVKEIGRELNTLLDDSVRAAYDDQWKTILEQLPETVESRFLGRKRHKERRVVADSVFRTFNDFELADDEMVRGDVILIGGDAYIAGEVQGAVIVLLGDLFLEGEAVVAGDAVSLGGHAEVDDHVQVSGKRFDLGGVAPGLDAGLMSASSTLGWLFWVVRLGVLVALLLVAHALAGGRLSVLADHARLSPGRTMAVGAIWYAAAFGLFVVAAFALVISVIGIPVVLVLVAGFLIATLLSYYAGCEVLGDRIRAMFGWKGFGVGWKTALLGIALLEFPAGVSLALASSAGGESAASLLTGLEFFLKILTISIGFGAVIATRLGGRPARGGSEPGSAAPVTAEA